MSYVLDETASDLPVRDMTINLSRLTAAPQNLSVHQHAREKQNIGKMSRDELEDRYLRLLEETQQQKQQLHKQNDKIKKLGTKLMKLVKDRGRMEQLAAGTAHAATRFRDVEMEEMVEELQEKVRALQGEKEGLKQRLLVAKQQILNSYSRRQTQYEHVPSRVNSGLKKLRDDASSPARPRSGRSMEAGRRPPTGQVPRYGHHLLEEARAEIRNLDNVVESQRSRMEELERASDDLKEELRRREEEFEERLLLARQQQTSTLKSQVSSNVSMIKLQKQLADRSNTVTELENRYRLLQEAQRTMKASNDAAMAKVDELTAQLKAERLKNLELDKQLQTINVTKILVDQLQERISDLEQERELLKESNKKLLNSAFDVSQQQKWHFQEQQLKLQIVQLETALKADLVDKNEILDRIKSERDKNEQLTEENQKLQLQFLEQKQQVEKLSERLKLQSREKDYTAAELTEALLLIKKQKCEKRGDLSFLVEVDEDGSSAQQGSIRELRASHAETIQELEKTRNLLNMESQISKDYKVELEAALRKMSSDKVVFEQKLERQIQLLDARAAKISKLEGQLRDIAYGTKTFPFKPDMTAADEADFSDEDVHLDRGENLLELQIVGASLTPPALQALGDAEPSTFCTYSFYLFEPHATPVATGLSPRYGFTSKYVMNVDEHLVEYLRRSPVKVELHQALGVEWRTVATAQLRLQQLLEQQGKVHGSIPLVGIHEDARSFGSLEYWLRLKNPITETTSANRDKMKAGDQPQSPTGASRNELLICVQRCRGLRSRSSSSPSPYIVYKFFNFPDYPTATVDDSSEPEFNDLKSYSVLMDDDLDRFLKTEGLQFYVFDYKEEQLDAYLGKTRVPLLSLTRGQEVSGMFELADPSGKPAGSLDVTLRWKSAYCPSAGITGAAEEPRLFPEHQAGEPVDPHQEQIKVEVEKKVGWREDVEEMLEEEMERFRSSDSDAAKVVLSTIRGQKTLERVGSGAKRVTFVDGTPEEEKFNKQSSAESLPEKQKTMFSPDVQAAPKAPHRTAEEGDDEEDESHVSEGQLVQDAQSCSDDSDISEEIIEDVAEAPAAAEPQGASDSDDCIVQGHATRRKLCERVRVEVVSLSLTPESRLARDDAVVRLFVEYNFLDLPTEETPLSLPKPPLGRSINFNYSKVILVDAENHAARRRLLKEVLQGRNSQMERIRFTVVSEPPEEEEQEKECEDVGVAYLRIPEILEKQADMMEASLSVLDVEDNSQVVGQLTVSMEGLQALRAIMEDQDLE
ncbi:protein fantom [Poeciliopsis prolifica]|uniref:protein fantom n=1 Tax=Poeciliopsis prolifica TaxID=188132 RepID=UPI002413AF90|nr:protein fantom [Poeciliopsis prolifica]XP_054897063.1 protein fantom [Poeciliopsis prolifica]